jgi:hypothetical protein
MSSSAAYIACMDGNLKTLKRLRANISDLDDALDCACKFGQVRVVKWLVEQGADVHRFKALGKACKFGHLNVVKFFYKCCADNDLFTILCATEFGHLSIAKWVYHRGKVKIPQCIWHRTHRLKQRDVLKWLDRVQPQSSIFTPILRRKRLLQLVSFL